MTMPPNLEERGLRVAGRGCARKRARLHVLGKENWTQAPDRRARPRVHLTASLLSRTGRFVFEAKPAPSFPGPPFELTGQILCWRHSDA